MKKSKNEKFLLFSYSLIKAYFAKAPMGSQGDKTIGSAS